MKNIEDLQKLDKAASLQNQVEFVSLQDKLGKQNFHEDIRKYLNLSLNHLKTPLEI